ncbi:glycosyltransferase [Mycobacterium sp. PS03-16]|uniref:WecB/TagA/CpsF family glycosyltransferase n=1 Tax=Mycobacterium sp. PS03-16 TaxID=2559611 RepID=UPI0010743EE0|nr:glycosyltransferase [Mycobacterium sp. PS03-16]
MTADGEIVREREPQERLRIGLLGLEVTPLTALEAATAATTRFDGKRLLLNHNLHSAYIHDTDETFRELYRQADWIVIDGTPVRWLASLSARREVTSDYRIGSTDWIAELRRVNAARRLFVFGASAESNARAVRNLSDMLPGWTVSGVDGYVPSGVALSRITNFNPDLVLVGLGMPRQESFLLTSLPHLPNATYATVGGAIDYLAGTTRLAPRWLGRFGLEWAWRLANQPKRLAHRYLVEPLLLLSRVLPRVVRDTF